MTLFEQKIKYIRDNYDNNVGISMRVPGWNVSFNGKVHCIGDEFFDDKFDFDSFKKIVDDFLSK